MNAIQGIYDPNVAEMAKGGIYTQKICNASRNIFRYIHKKGKTLPVPISSLMVPVRGKSRYKHIEEVRAWPILYLSSWFRTAFQHPYDGFFLLGGYKINHLDSIKGMLRHFWERYKGIDDVCPHDPELTIPFFLHGDEGRGQCHRPVLVLAAQPIIGWKGEECVTSTQYLVVY